MLYTNSKMKENEHLKVEIHITVQGKKEVSLVRNKNEIKDRSATDKHICSTINRCLTKEQNVTFITKGKGSIGGGKRSASYPL